MDNWLFVENVPLLYPQKKIARQMQVEMWLDYDAFARLLQELGLEAMQHTTKKEKPHYIV
jgi:hypothetical protein